jgi:hypothetical protein
MALSETVWPFLLAVITSKEPRGRKPASGLRCGVILLVGHMLHPGDVGSLPMFLARRDPNGVVRPDLPDSSTRRSEPGRLWR